MVLDFTIEAYILLTAYLLLYLTAGFGLYFGIKRMITILKNLSSGSIKERETYQGALSS